MSDDESNSDVSYVIKCRGLPWSATADEIAEFFSDCQLENGSESIHITLTQENRPSGEAFVEMASDDDIELALKKDHESMGKRYVEVYKVPRKEMEEVLGNGGKIPAAESNISNDNVVKLRGLPYEATKQDVYNFFEGLQITNNGILLTTDYQGRASGEAFVQFTSEQHTQKALEKNKKSMGHRYIEVFRSSMTDAQRSQMKDGFRGGRGGGMVRGGRPGPYDRMGPAGGPGFGRGYGAQGPGGRGSRSFKSFGGGGGGPDSFYGNSGNFGGPGGGYGGYGGPGGAMPSGPPGPPRHIVRMRGLPFRVSEKDIAEWFSSVVDPVDIRIKTNTGGRPTGEADVLFGNESDARRAMTKDRQNMQHRYVELFYDPPTGGPAGGMGMGGGPGYGGGAGGRGAGYGGAGGGYGDSEGGYNSGAAGYGGGSVGYPSGGDDYGSSTGAGGYGSGGYGSMGGGASGGYGSAVGASGYGSMSGPASGYGGSQAGRGGPASSGYGTASGGYGSAAPSGGYGSSGGSAGYSTSNNGYSGSAYGGY